MSGVVSLQPLVHVKQDDHGGDEIHRFSSGEQVKVGATVSTTVAIAEQESGQGMKERKTLNGSITHVLLCFLSSQTAMCFHLCSIHKFKLCGLKLRSGEAKIIDYKISFA